MQIKVDGIRPEKVQVTQGDVIEKNGRFYLVLSVQGRFVAKNLNGINGFNGVYDSLAELNNALEREHRDITIYRQSEWNLLLQRK